MLALLALATAPVQEAPPPEPDRCNVPPGQGHWLEVERKPARPGATIAITPTIGVSFLWKPEGEGCTTDWQVSHPEMVTVAPDLRSLHVTESAVAGTTVTVSYTAEGKRVSAAIRIVGKDELVITGRRSGAADERCPAAERVGELEFRDNGSFAVTYQPFERYVDYWGTYSFDPATGALEMKTAGGNFIPRDLDLSGTAAFDAEGRLVLSGVHLGSRNGFPQPPPEGCTYRF